mmetsp:Transcript_55538/g.124932  ORF Transcript_55538/g.124932 Transcript_55538/m.124932 type:complete len:728 (-) Transcript_55538:4-2187(-)
MAMPSGIPNAAFREQCAQAISYAVAHFLHNEAIFFAERLAAEAPTEETLCVVAEAHLRAGNLGRVYMLLKHRDGRNPKLLYLFARACYLLGKHEEAKQALLGPQAFGRIAFDLVPGGGAGLYLLGQTCECLGARDAAIDCYSKSLEVCPFMWGAFERLSYLLAAAQTAESLATACFSDQRFEACVAFQQAPARESPGVPRCLDVKEEQPVASPRSDRRRTAYLEAPKKRRRSEGDPGIYPADLLEDEDVENCVHQQPSSEVAGQGRPDLQLAHAAPSTPVRAGAASPQSPFASLPPARNFLVSLSKLSPYRLFSSASPARRRGTGLVSSPRSLPRSPLLRPASHLLHNPLGVLCRREVGRLGETVPLSLGSFLRCLGRALHESNGYLSREALRRLQLLPTAHQNTLYVQALRATCHLELGEHKVAVSIFKTAWEVFPRDPWFPVDVYSTALWHVGDAVQLSLLGHEALLWNRQWAKAWCAVGNCFSLQREHERALKCFRRAILLDPAYTYAHTLSGHELAACDKLEEAAAMYNQAVVRDPQHYNAWWGLGNVYMRQEDLRKARYHYHRAVQLNSKNAVVLAALGQVCQKLGEPLQALELFTAATNEGCACRAMALFQQGCTLSTLGRHADAIECLQRAREQVPQEPCVHFELGRALAATGRSVDALMHFTSAMDLCGAKDSKAQQVIECAQTELLQNVVHMLPWRTADAHESPECMQPLVTSKCSAG